MQQASQASSNAVSNASNNAQASFVACNAYGVKPRQEWPQLDQPYWRRLLPQLPPRLKPLSEHGY